jgi:hypothetical protein
MREVRFWHLADIDCRHSARLLLSSKRTSLVLRLSPLKLEMLVALYKTRASGLRRVEYQDGNSQRIVEYRTDGELAAAIADLEGRIAGAQGKYPVSVTYLRSEKGWA